MSDTPSPSGKLIVGHDGPVTTITLNRPKVHNALDQELSAELNAAVKDVSVDRDCRILVIRGAGETFCAEDDIKGFQNFAPGDGPWEIRMYQETANIIDNLVPVTIAAVDGVCTGGGLELTLVCDLVIATTRSRWGMPEINWDITPGWGGTGRLSKFAGRQYPNDQMVRYTHDWVLFDEENGRVVFCARTHMADPGDGSSHSATNWTMIDYAGSGLFSREEDIYNLANFVKLFEDWQAAEDGAGS